MNTPQKPLGSGFGAASTTTEVIDGIDLTGKVAIVTGGNSGLGLEAAKTLAAAGADVVIADREHERALEVTAGFDNVQCEYLDLLDPDSIDTFAEKFVASQRELAIQINSAGIMACPLTRDSRGYEWHFATNHLGHFQLTARLWPALARAAQARVVSVSSIGHRYSPVDFDDVNWEGRDYHPSAAYGQSKSANALFAVGLDRRGRKDGVRAFAVHPGAIPGTGLERWVAQETMIAAGIIDETGNPLLDPDKQIKTVPQGAATAIWCATNPCLEGLGGVYCENCDIAGVMSEEPDGLSMADATRLHGVMPHAIDPQTADRLWELSEQMLGLTFL
jgi:NAD(P)-dependent dehydrogenase (short-subunit alcohol dehydrogenase family)